MPRSEPRYWPKNVRVFFSSPKLRDTVDWYSRSAFSCVCVYSIYRRARPVPCLYKMNARLTTRIIVFLDFGSSSIDDDDEKPPITNGLLLFAARTGRNSITKRYDARPSAKRSSRRTPAGDGVYNRAARSVGERRNGPRATEIFSKSYTYSLCSGLFLRSAYMNWCPRTDGRPKRGKIAR